MRKTTVVRTVMFVIVVVNMVLKYTGKEQMDIDETTVYRIVECLVSVATFVLCFWKNNSFTKNAQAADKYLEELRKFDEEE